MTFFHTNLLYTSVNEGLPNAHIDLLVAKQFEKATVQYTKVCLFYSQIRVFEEFNLFKCYSRDNSLSQTSTNLMSTTG